MRFLSALFVLLLCGFAVKPVSSVHSSSFLEIVLSGKGKGEYTLLDDNKAEVATTSSKSKKIRFSIPAKIDRGGCFSVVDRKGRMLGDNKLALPLVDKHQKVAYYKAKLEKDVASSLEDGRMRNEQLRSILNNLNENRAFTGKTCSTHVERALPAMPSRGTANIRDKSDTYLGQVPDFLK